MSRASKFDDLHELARILELQSLSKLAMRKKALKTMETKIRHLSEIQFQATTVHQAEYVSRWQLWRHTALREMNQELASLRVLERQAARSYGRSAATCAVVNRLAERNRLSIEQELERRKTYVS